MTSADRLANLEKARQLTKEPASQAEIDGLLQSGKARLHDASNATNSVEGRFDLAYNAAHALSLAALRRAGYRAENRHIVFKVLPDTAGLAAEDWRVLDVAHERRNRAEYEGIVNIDEQLVRGVIAVAQKVLAALEKSPPAAE